MVVKFPAHIMGWFDFIVCGFILIAGICPEIEEYDSTIDDFSMKAIL